MGEAFLLISNITKSGGAEEFIQFVISYFSDRNPILYFVGDHRESAYNPEGFDTAEILYDSQISTNRPDTPNKKYLHEFQKRHGTTKLWQSAYADRKLSKDGELDYYHNPRCQYTHEEVLTHIEARCRALDPLFTEYDIDFVYGHEIMRMPGMLIKYLADDHDIPFFRASNPRIQEYFTVFENEYEESHLVNEAFRRFLTAPRNNHHLEQARDYIKSVSRGAQPWEKPDYDFDQYNSTEPLVKTMLRLPLDAFRLGRTIVDDGMKSEYYYDTSAARYLIEQNRARFRQHYYRFSEPFNDPSWRAEFVFFPLQAQPELSLMVLSPYKLDLVTVSQNIARTLPIGKKLVIKEHPRMVGHRPLGYYKRLRNEPNIEVVYPTVDAMNLVQHSDGVVSLSSTVGLQSIMSKTPTFVLGRPGYHQLETVRTPKTYTELENQLAMLDDITVDVEEVAAFVAANATVGIPSDHPEFWEYICRYVDASLTHSTEEALNELLRFNENAREEEFTVPKS